MINVIDGENANTNSTEVTHETGASHSEAHGPTKASLILFFTMITLIIGGFCKVIAYRIGVRIPYLKKNYLRINSSPTLH
jgi:hypothetical protein